MPETPLGDSSLAPGTNSFLGYTCLEWARLLSMERPVSYGPAGLSLLDRLAERIYARSARAMFAVILGVCLLNGAIVTAAAVLSGTRYWVRYLDLTTSQATRIGITAGIMTVLALLITAAVLRDLEPVSTWLAERTEAAARPPGPLLRNSRLS